MPELLLLILIAINTLLLIFLLLKRKNKDSDWSKNLLKNIENFQNNTEKKIFDEFSRNREEFNKSFIQLRKEIQGSITKFSDSIFKHMMEISGSQNNQFVNIRKTVEEKLKSIQEDNNKKLEEMRLTVDEKLHSTLEKRLSEVFKQVSDRLEKVHQGLGEMQKLATGVGDLQKVLTNVKSRGMLGEIQLKNQLDQLLSIHQYEQNVNVKEGSNNFVEFAIKLPGKDDAKKSVWLPIDSKFPLEKYEILLDAYDNGDKESISQASKKLISEIKIFAKDIAEKYIDPPNTTDFALMYLPVEGLYAEVLRLRGLFETLQREYRIVPVGPTTLAAILNSLQMGFATLAIEKRSSEVWKLLSAIKTQFGKFGDLLDKTQKKLSEASKTIEDASKKSRHIESRLNKVQELPSTEATKLLKEK